MPAPQYDHDDLFVMVDVETTGLDYDNDHMLEIGLAVVRAEDLEVLATWDTLLCPNPAWQTEKLGGEWSQFAWESSSSYVRELHNKNGLWKDLAEDELDTYTGAEDLAMKFLEFWFPGMEDVGPMVGSNVANFDRRFIYNHMPLLHGRFHYRNIDFSTVKELCRRFNKPVYSKLPAKNEIHRVIPDLYDTVNEAKFYIDNFLWV